MRWCLNGNDTFDVSSFYKAIHGTIGVPFLGRVHGALKPQRGFLFLCGWLFGVKSLLLIISLRRASLSLVGVAYVGRSGETVSHLLLHCDVTYALCSEVFSMFEVW